MLERTSGKNAGLSFEGKINIAQKPSQPIVYFGRPYLHVYARSNELEETSVISLTGVKIEHNPEMDTLFGVSNRSFTTSHRRLLTFVISSASFYVHGFHRFEFLCARGPQCKGTSTMDIQARSDTPHVIALIFTIRFSFVPFVFVPFAFVHTNSFLTSTMDPSIHPRLFVIRCSPCSSLYPPTM